MGEEEGGESAASVRRYTFVPRRERHGLLSGEGEGKEGAVSPSVRPSPLPPLTYFS